MGLGVVWGFFIPDVGQCLKGCVTQTRSDLLLLAQLCQWHQQCPGAGILWVLSFGGFSAPPFRVCTLASHSQGSLALPTALGLAALLGLLLVYGVCGRERCWIIFREDVEVLGMTWSLMALLRSEILQANSSYSGAFKCFSFFE